MTSLMTRPVLLFLGLMLITKASYAEPSLNLRHIMAVFNGIFSNSKQVRENVYQHDLIGIRMKPVLIPQLYVEPMLLMEESVNGSIYRMFVGRVYENVDGKNIYIDLFNFTDFSRLQPMTYNTDDLKNIPREQFTSYGPCPFYFLIKSPVNYVGEWEDCRQTINGKQYYNISIECEGVTFTTSLGSFETPNPVPYKMLPIGPKFPLINALLDLFNPCPLLG